jgi:hypothetical protein
VNTGDDYAVASTPSLGCGLTQFSGFCHVVRSEEIAQESSQPKRPLLLPNRHGKPERVALWTLAVTGRKKIGWNRSIA